MGAPSRRRRLASIAAATIALLGAAGCSSDDDTAAARQSSPAAVSADDTTTTTPNAPTVAAPEGGYTIELVATLVDSGRVRIDGTTNLPEGTEVLLETSRTFLQTNDTPDNPRATSLGSKRVDVTGGAFSTTVALDGSALEIEPFDATFRIRSISPVVAVCAVVAPGAQSDEVRAVIGDAGEGFVGSFGATVFGSATDHPSTWLDVQTTVAVDVDIDDLAEIHGRAPVVEALDDFCV